MSTSTPTVPMNKLDRLPEETLATIVDWVHREDERWRASEPLRSKYSARVQRARRDASIRSLSRVSKKLRRIAVPHLFEVSFLPPTLIPISSMLKPRRSNRKSRLFLSTIPRNFNASSEIMDDSSADFPYLPSPPLQSLSLACKMSRTSSTRHASIIACSKRKTGLISGLGRRFT